MKIILDVMNGDKVSSAAVLGAIDAVKCADVEITLVGREAQILKILNENGMEALPAGMETVPSGDGVREEDSLVDMILRRKDSSIMTGLRMLSEGCGDAFVSTVSVDRLLAGMPLREEAYTLLKQAAGRSFVSFDGNLLVKSLEDTAGFIGDTLKQMMKKNPRTILWSLRGKFGMGALMQLRNCRERMRILRVRKPVMLVRYPSDGQMFHNAIVQTIQAVDPKQL